MTIFSNSAIQFSLKDEAFVVSKSQLSLISSGHLFENVYDDSEDLGLTVMTKSGIAVKFVIVDIEKYQDEIVKWVLIPTDSAIHKMPGLKNTRLIINNV
jgi:hypothetical protein